MKLTKRIVSFVLAMLLVVLSTFSAMAASFTDVSTDLVSYEAINTLANLGIIMGYPDGTFGPERSITRAEFSALITRVLGLSDVASGVTSCPFPDVQPTHYAIGNIKLGYDMGIISGFPDGTFHPDETVTYEQAVKMVVAALGYTLRANDRGGYPLGYITVAAELGVSEDVTPSANNAPATRGIVAQLLYNALEVNMAEQQGNGATITDKTLLKDNLKMTRIEGQIEANEYSSLTDGIYLGENQIRIGTTKLYVGEDYADFIDQLGMQVIAYYKYDSSIGDNVVQSIILDPNKNVVKTIQSEDIDEKNGATFTYWETSDHNTQTRSITLPSTAKVLYNSKYMPANEFFNQNLIPDNGTMTLIDSQNTGTYDVIIVKSYISCILSLAPTANTLYNELGSDKSITIPQDGAGTVVVTRNGNSSRIGELQKGDVLSIAASRDNTYMEIIATSKSFSGTIRQVMSNGQVQIDGQNYQYTKELMKYFETENPSRPYTPGTTATFSLNEKGQIAWYKEAASAVSTEKYGYLINAGIDSTGISSDDVIVFNIFTQDGKEITYKGANNIRVDGIAGMKADAILQRLADNALLTNKDILDPADPSQITDQIRNAAKYSQLVRFTTDNKTSSGSTLVDQLPAITSLDTITKDPSESSESLTMPANSTYSKEGLKYNGSAFGSYATPNSATKIFYVPLDRSSDSGYAMRSMTYFQRDSSYLFEAFDVSSTGTCKVMVLYGNSDDTRVTVASTPIIVTGISSRYEEDGTVEVLTGYDALGNTKTFTTDVVGAFMNSRIKIGQVVRIPNKIVSANSVAVEFDPSTATTNPPAIPTTGSDYNNPLRYKEYDSSNRLLANQGANVDAYYRTMFATVLAVDETSVRFTSLLPTDTMTPDDPTASTYSFSNNTRFFVYDASLQEGNRVSVKMNEEGRLMLMGYDEVSTNATQVFIYSTNQQLQMVYIVKKPA